MDELTTPRQRRLSKFRRDGGGFGPFRLSPKDLEILRLIHDYRYVTADHIFALVPGNKRHLAERLQGLFHHEYVQRLLPPAVMRVADSPPRGSEKFTYVLDEKGAETLAAAERKAVRELLWEPRHVNRMDWFVEHRLMIATFRAAVELALKARPDLNLIEWRDEPEIRDAVLVRQVGGKVQELRVAPDGYFAVRQNGKLRHFFLEADRGTEEHTRVLPKFRALWWYCGPNSPFQRRYEEPEDVRVLVVCESENRLLAMRKTLAGVDEKQRGLKRFWFCLSREYSLVMPEGILGGIWRVGSTDVHERGSAQGAVRRLFDQ
jgi:hypothetical protein